MRLVPQTYVLNTSTLGCLAAKVLTNLCSSQSLAVPDVLISRFSLKSPRRIIDSDFAWHWWMNFRRSCWNCHLGLRVAQPHVGCEDVVGGTL
jgi:hypothetical protein